MQIFILLSVCKDNDKQRSQLVSQHESALAVALAQSRRDCEEKSAQSTRQQLAELQQQHVVELRRQQGQFESERQSLQIELDATRERALGDAKSDRERLESAHKQALLDERHRFEAIHQQALGDAKLERQRLDETHRQHSLQLQSKIDGLQKEIRTACR